jgi:hypothetical protein
MYMNFLPLTDDEIRLEAYVAACLYVIKSSQKPSSLSE